MASGRHVVGAVLVDLIKFIKNLERKLARPVTVSALTRSVVDRHVGLAEWVPVEVFIELFNVLDTVVLRGDEDRAMEMGAAGGATMRGVQKAYSVHGDAMTSVISMRLAWRAHYDFGKLVYQRTSENSLRFTVEDYPDMPMPHALMTAGWGVAAARAAGSTSVAVKVLARPWQGAPAFDYEISF